MSILATQALETRSSSADIARTSADEGELSKVQRLDEVPKAPIMERTVQEEASEGIKSKKDTKKKKTGKKVEGRRKQDRERTREESSVSQEEYWEEANEEDSIGESASGTRGIRRRAEDGFNLDGLTSYELLGLRSAEPSSRPPILEMTRGQGVS